MTGELGHGLVVRVWDRALSRLSERLRAFQEVFVGKAMESKTVWHLNYRELDERITEVFGRRYRSLVGLGWRVKGNDTELLIDMRDWEEAYEHAWIAGMGAPSGASDAEIQAAYVAMLAETVNRWTGEDTSPAPEVVLGVAIRDGKMPPGWYLLEISW